MRRGARDVRVMSRRTIYRSRLIRLTRECIRVRGRAIARDTIHHPGAVVVLPFLDRSHVVLVRQYRHAVGRELLELPAGTLGQGERPLTCARRELEEETGWQAGWIAPVTQFYTAPGILSEQMTLFVAGALRRTKPRPEPDEFVEPVVLSLKKAVAEVRAGRIRDAKTIVGLLLAHECFGRSARLPARLATRRALV